MTHKIYLGMLRGAALGIAAENPQPCAGLCAYRQGEDLQRKARAAGNAIIMKPVQKSLNNQHITTTSR